MKMVNWKFSSKAIEFLLNLALNRSKPSFIEFQVQNGGQSTAQLSVNFFESQNLSNYVQFDICSDLKAVCLINDKDYLENMTVDFITDETGGGELEIQAPCLYGDRTQWNLVDQINQFIASEIAPFLQAHNGSAKIIDINPQNEAILEFAGGCQGCSMARVTLKSGIEKKIKQKFPEITQVVDSTDHQQGKNPYYSDIS